MNDAPYTSPDEQRGTFGDAVGRVWLDLTLKFAVAISESRSEQGQRLIEIRRGLEEVYAEFTAAEQAKWNGP